MADNKEDKDEIIAVTDEDLANRALDEEEGKKPLNARGEEDHDDDQEEDEDDEQRLGKSEEEDEEKESNRERRKRRRQRQREARERLERENRYFSLDNDRLEKKINELERRLNGTAAFSIDGRIAQTEAAIKKADSVIADAISNGKGEDATEAQRIRDNLRDTLSQLKTAKQQSTQQRSVESNEERHQAAPNPILLDKARAWAQRNSWFDFKRGDYNSRIAGAIDDALAAEGYDPTTDAYWEELDERIQESLPNLKRSKRARKDDDDDEPESRQGKKPNGGPKFRGSGGTKNLKKGEYYLSPERVSALKEAGIWDDPEARAKMIKRYRDHDRENQQSQ